MAINKIGSEPMHVQVRPQPLPQPRPSQPPAQTEEAKRLDADTYQAASRPPVVLNPNDVTSEGRKGNGGTADDSIGRKGAGGTADDSIGRGTADDSIGRNGKTGTPDDSIGGLPRGGRKLSDRQKG